MIALTGDELKVLVTARDLLRSKSQAHRNLKITLTSHELSMIAAAELYIVETLRHCYLDIESAAVSS